MTTNEPGERRPLLDRPPGDRYGPSDGDDDGSSGIPGGPLSVLAVVLAGALLYTILGGILDITAGLIVAAGFIGWLVGKLVSPPVRAAIIGVAAVLAGLLGIWAFGRIEGGVLDPISYFDQVQGWILVALQLLAGGGMAAAASR